MARADRTIFIGDIHGCAHEFRLLLEKVAPSFDDRIVLMGDLVNKGPDPEGVFDIYRSLDCVCLLGNHEADHLHWRDDNWTPKPDSRETRRLMSPDGYAAFLALAERMPLMYEDEFAIAVHGGLLEGIALHEQPREVLIGETTLPLSWKDHLALDRPLVVGHKRYSRVESEPYIIESRFYGIDTACVYGGCLTALILPEGRVVRVPATRVYAEVHAG
jgi:hypothetical protein